MPSVSPARFLEVLEASRLLTAEQLAEATAAVERAGGNEADLRPVAQQLVRQKWLTRWQVQQLLAGRHSFALGRYRLLEKIGAGGMGAVFKAEQAAIGRVVAIKVMSPEGLKTPQAVARFHREIQTLSAVNHPNIIQAIDADTVGEVHFLVMEYVDGKDLKQWVDEYGRLPVDWACECVMQAAAGLQHAHERGLIHRDIKPGNILVVSDDTGAVPQVKILDLGLARFANRDEKADGDLTATGQIMGSVDYMAPEQAKNTKLADIRSDIFSLGCTLFRLLAGEQPFGGESVMEKLMARTQPAPLIRTIRDDVPPVLEQVIAKMLATNPEQRYQTPGEVERALAPFAITTKGTSEPSSSLRLPTGTSTVMDFDSSGDRNLDDFLGALASQPDLDRTQALPAKESTVNRGKGSSVTRLNPLTQTLGGAAENAVSAPASGVVVAPPTENALWRDPKVLGLAGGGLVCLLIAGWFVFGPRSPDLGANPSNNPAKQGSTAVGKSRDWTDGGEAGPTIALFNGQSLAGWKPIGWDGVDVSKVFTVLPAERLLQVRGGGGSAMLVHQEPQHRNYRLRLEYQGGASSQEDQLLVYHSARDGEANYIPLRGTGVGGVGGGGSRQYQRGVVAGDRIVPTGQAPVKHVPGTRNFEKPAGEWNALELWCLDDTAIHVLNGDVTCVLGSITAQVAGVSQAVTSGEIALSGKQGELRIRRFELTPISSYPSALLALAKKTVGAAPVAKVMPPAKTTPTKTTPPRTTPAPPTQPVVPPSPTSAPFTAEAARETQERWAKYLKREVFESNAYGMKLALLPPGEFDMGAADGEPNAMPRESPRRRVRLTRPCYVGVHEVTQAQYQAVMNANPSHHQGAEGGGLNLPVENLTWNEATEFCRKLSLHPTEKAQGRLYRLPTEAQWEYACRAGTETPYAFGAEITAEQATFDLSEPRTELRKTTPVGKYKPNAFGLYDLHGNVFEWCQDSYLERAYDQLPATDPLAPDQPASEGRVVRGGNFGYRAEFLRSASRDRFQANSKRGGIGFRVVCEISMPKALLAVGGIRTLFNGRDLTGWEAPQGETGFTVAGETLVAEAGTLKSSAFLATPCAARDFVFRCEFRSPGCNSGIGLWFERLKLEVDIARTTGFMGALFTPSHPSFHLQTQQAGFRVNDWNQLEIARVGDRLSVVLNGQVIQDVSAQREARLADLGDLTHVAIQRHEGRCAFQKLTLEELVGFSSATPTPNSQPTPPDVPPRELDAWTQRVAALPASQQIEEVRKALEKRNAGFDGKLQPTLAGDRVIGLELSADAIVDVYPIRALTRLKTLTLRGSGPGKSRLFDLRPLRGLELTELAFSNTSVSDLSPLIGMPLEQLSFFGAPVFDLKPLAGMPLLSLDCSQTKVKSLDGVQNLPLTTLWCHHVTVSDLTPLKGMKLKDLSLGSTRATDLSPLADMPLANLDLGNVSGLTDLSPLKNLPLEKLHCESTGVVDLTPLSGTRLKMLRCDLAEYPPRMSALEALASLKELQNWNTLPVKDLPPAVLLDYAQRYQKLSPQSRPGLKADFFKGTQFDQPPTTTRTMPWVGWNWGWGHLDKVVIGGSISIRLTGRLTAPKPGAYKLRCRVQDQATLWIDGREVLTVSEGETSVTTELTGKPQTFRLHFTKNQGVAHLMLYWKPDGGAEELIPPEAFSQPER